MNEHIYSISEITREIKLLLEDTIPTVWVLGEVSNFKHHYSGHLYFTLKDASAQLSAVMWSSRASLVDFDLQNGVQVRALGNIRVYEKAGRYQLDVFRMETAGVGALQIAFEELKQKLGREGLFEETNKKEMPSFPSKIGIVTSETGAAVQDIIHIVSRRAPGVQMILKPVKVQGEGAAREIAEAIDDFNRFKEVDLLIVGRGGGSLEDLWAFNEESVARAIFASEIPVISAVGHEIDFTIADFVADLRAPTPSAAAELAVPDQQQIRRDITETHRRMQFLVGRRIDYLKEKIEAIQKSYGLKMPVDMVRQYAQQVDDLAVRLHKNMKLFHSTRLEKSKNLASRLGNMSPKHVLKRGYSITYQQDKILTDAALADRDEMLVTELKTGRLESRIVSTKKGKNDERS